MPEALRVDAALRVLTLARIARQRQRPYGHGALIRDVAALMVAPPFRTSAELRVNLKRNGIDPDALVNERTPK